MWWLSLLQHAASQGQKRREDEESGMRQNAPTAQDATGPGGGINTRAHLAETSAQTRMALVTGVGSGGARSAVRWPAAISAGVSDGRRLSATAARPHGYG